MLNKGFLGPIGDDLPSLIPLLFALLIFFATFSFSYSAFSQKNTSFQRDLDVLNIARVLKGTNYVSGYQAFIDSCNSLNPTNVKYVAVISNYFTSPERYFEQNTDITQQEIRPYLLEPFKVEGDPGKSLECLSPGVERSGFDEAFFEENPFVVKIYPLVVEDNRVVKPMHLVVVAWTE